MAASSILQIRSKGTLTLPIEFRRKYGLEEGDVFTLIDLGDGSFLFTPRVTQVDRLGDRVAKVMEQEGVSVDDILKTLDEERERYYQERYVQD
jgi:bifunctional DNA-binding transcriptional regulator/antitoxin component of YhaV-PrlF toxin-antitoxin module